MSQQSDQSSFYLSAEEQSDQWSEKWSDLCSKPSSDQSSDETTEESSEDESSIWMFLYKLLDKGYVPCNRMECICSSASSLRSTTASVPSAENLSSSTLFDFEDLYNIFPPPANTLPKPRWCENITTNGDAKPISDEASPESLHNWIRASIPKVGPQWNSTIGFPVPSKELDHVDYSWPPLPASIWSKEKLQKTIETEQLLSYEPEKKVYGSPSVEAFFRYFDGTQNNLNTTHTFSPCQPSTSSHVDG